jgi:hypothetical protein
MGYSRVIITKRYFSKMLRKAPVLELLPDEIYLILTELIFQMTFVMVYETL